MDVLGIKTRVKRQFGDEAGVQITNEDIMRWINDAQLEIVRKTECLEAKSVASTVVGDNSYAVPTDFIRIERVTLDGYKLEETTFEEIDRDYPNRDVEPSNDTPRKYYLWSRNIFLFPTPAAVEELAVYYIKEPDELTVDEDVPEIPKTYHSAIVMYCLSQAKLLNEEAKEAQAIKSEMDVELTLGENEHNAEVNYPSVRLSPGDDEWHQYQ